VFGASQLVRSLTVVLLPVALVITLSLAACIPAAYVRNQPTSRQLEGYLLLWHDWTGQESALLDNLLDRFQQLHPNVTVISLTVPPDQLVQTFSERVAAGLGPDLLLVDAGLVYDLAQAGLLKDFGQRADIHCFLIPLLTPSAMAKSYMDCPLLSTPRFSTTTRNW
jgi:ABC-type glycerol-3-phosphate transport system substrate-binding protein